MNKQFAVITGGSSGIGLATAISFAQRGINIHLIARNITNLERVKNDIEEKFGIIVFIYSCDVSSYADLEVVFESIHALSNIDYLICNAGVMICGKIEDISVSDLERTMNINYYGTLNTYKAAIGYVECQHYFVPRLASILLI